MMSRDSLFNILVLALSKAVFRGGDPCAITGLRLLFEDVRITICHSTSPPATCHSISTELLSFAHSFDLLFLINSGLSHEIRRDSARAFSAFEVKKYRDTMATLLT